MIIIRPKIQFNNKIIRPKTQYYNNNQTRHNIISDQRQNIIIIILIIRSKTQYNNSNVSHLPNWICLYIMCPARYKKDYFIKIDQDHAFTKDTFELKCSIPFQRQCCACVNKQRMHKQTNRSTTEYYKQTCL